MIKAIVHMDILDQFMDHQSITDATIIVSNSAISSMVPTPNIA
jgi:hypothetical protein